jgi:tryptophan synthase beta chain
LYDYTYTLRKYSKVKGKGITSYYARAGGKNVTGNRIDLTQDDIPRKWYNILPDLPDPLPPYIDVETKKEIRHLPDIFTNTASRLEFSEEKWITIPDEVIDGYIRCGRPSFLMRARKLESYLKTPAHIYYKNEGLSPVGTFKINTAIPQAFWAFKEGKSRTVFSGSSTTRTKFAHAIAARIFDLTPTLFMTRGDCERSLEQVFFLKKMLLTDLRESPSSGTSAGRRILEANPNHKGTMSLAQEEVAEEVKNNRDAVVSYSSFLNHVLLTQTITGLEVEKQLELIDEEPNIMIAPVGAGSSIHGLIAPFIKKRTKDHCSIKFLAVESETSDKLTSGKYGYLPLHGSMSGSLVKAYESNWNVPPLSIGGKGIQTKNTAPIVSFLRYLGIIDTRVYPSDEKAIIEAAKIFLMTENILLSQESAYAVKAAIDEAIKAKRERKETVIVLNLSGTSYLDFGEKTKYYQSSRDSS